LSEIPAEAGVRRVVQFVATKSLAHFADRRKNKMKASDSALAFNPLLALFCSKWPKLCGKDTSSGVPAEYPPLKAAEA